MQPDHTISAFLDLCHLIHAKGLVSGSGGNVSLRFGDQIVITPSGRSLQLLKESDLIFLSRDGSFRSKNNGIPSKEWRIHLACYDRADVGAVIHVHSVNAVAVSCLPSLDPTYAIPVYSPGYGIRVGKLPILPYATPGTIELAEGVEAVIEKRNSVMLANHGILAVGATAEDALNIIEEIEDEAKLYFLLAGQGRALSEEQQAQLPPMGMRR